MKKQDILRCLKFSGITIGSSIVLILILFTFDSNPFREEYFKIELPELAAQLDEDAEKYIKNSNTLNDYPYVITAISSAVNQGMMPRSKANYLYEKLAEAYKKHVFEGCEHLLLNDGSNYQVNLTNLSRLEASLGSLDKINFYKGQLNAHNYYHNQLPNEIDSWCSYQRAMNFYFFDYSKAVALHNKAENITQLSSNYISRQLRSKLLERRQKLLNLIDDSMTF